MLETYRAVLGAEPEEFDSARDDSGHGTHTASTAAGNAKVLASIFGKPVARIAGIAPRARVVAYKGLGEQGGFTSDLAAAIDQAVADGVDVINFSIGGGASLPAADEIAFLFAADAGVFVATSAGNEDLIRDRRQSGDDALGHGRRCRHPATLLRGRRDAGQREALPRRIRDADLGRRPLVDAANAGSDICEAGKLDANKVAGKIVLCLRGVTGRLEKSKAVFEAGGVGMILYNTTDVDDLFTDNHWVPSVHVDNQPGLAIKAYVATASNPTARISVRTDLVGHAGRCSGRRHR